MYKEVNIIFHNQGLRSYIEVDLCSACPRHDDKGCCGYYSPVFYPTDFAYLLKNQPDLLQYIINLDDTTVLDASITVNNTIEGNSYRCHFHSKEGGCRLSQQQRESVCRHFVCPGINWEKEEELQHWKEFFTRLSDYEIMLNNSITDELKLRGLTLRGKNNRDIFFQQLLSIFEEKTLVLPEFFASCPPREEFRIVCEIKYGEDWPL